MRGNADYPDASIPYGQTFLSGNGIADVLT